MKPIIFVKIKGNKYRFSDVEEARAIVVGYIKRWKIRRRDWSGGQVVVRGKEIGRFDYDGNFIERRSYGGRS